MTRLLVLLGILAYGLASIALVVAAPVEIRSPLFQIAASAWGLAGLHEWFARRRAAS